jgi:hypothetical protein
VPIKKIMKKAKVQNMRQFAIMKKAKVQNMPLILNKAGTMIQGLQQL